MARVMVTGATGFVGGRVTRRLRGDGHDVAALVRRPSSSLDDLGVRQVPGDLATLRPDDLAGVDAVVHAAAVVGHDLEAARTVNRDGTRSVLDAAVTAGTRRMVHLSTAAVYDRGAADELVGEDAPLVVDGTPYAVTKVEAEDEVARGSAEDLSTAVLRPPAVLGAGPSSTWGTAMPRRARDGTLPPQHPEATFGFVHVDDLVDAVVAAIGATGDVIVNVVGGHVTWGDYGGAIRAMFVEAPEAPPPERAPWRGRYDTRALPVRLGVTPTRDFDDGMAEIRASWRDGDPDG